MKIGITGAAGNVGTTLRKGLAKDFDLTLFDKKKIPDPEGKAIEIDFGIREKLNGVFDGLDALLHLAGDPSPNAPAASTLRNNFTATSYVFEEAKKAGVRKIVFASSNFYHEAEIGLVLSGRSKSLISLDRPPSPRCLYGQSKVFGETVGLHLSHLGVQFAALRIGWTVPEDDPAAYGGAYMRAVFCSHRDLVQAFKKAIAIDRDFLAAFAVSANGHPVFDLNETRKELGFNPQDDAEAFF